MTAENRRNMEFYFAPMEGITSYTYRNLHHRFFGGVEKYYTPFLSPSAENGLSTRELKDVLPENNGEIRPVPQLLVNHPEGFLKGARLLRDLGYREINLNLGCPSGTVTAKKKGSGLLMYPEELDALLDRIFSDPMVTGGEILVSVKTRIGKNSPEEWSQLMEIYNQYPIYELTIHPRIQKDFYKNHPDLEVFSSALEASKNPVVYNGDIFTAADYRRFREQFPAVERIMLGRGLIMDPELGEKLLKIEAEETGMDRVCKETEDGPDLVRLRQFHDALFEAYGELMSGDRNVLFRMKELWAHMIVQFPDSPKLEKRIKKSTHLSEYTEAVNELFKEAGHGV